MTFFKQIFKANSWYLLINLISASSAIFLIPLYISDLSVSEYGILALMNVTFAFLTIFMTVNLESAVQTFYFDHADDATRVHQYFRNVYSFATLLALTGIILFSLLGPLIFRYTFRSDAIDFFPNGMIVAVSAALTAINQIYFVLLRNQEKVRTFGSLTLVSTVLNILSQVVFIIFLDLGITGALLGPLVANVVIFAITQIQNHFLTLNIDFNEVKSSLKYCLWLLPFLMIQWFLAKGDRIIIESYIGLEQVGIYALLMNISMVVSLVATSILNSVRPTLFRALKSSGGKPGKTARSVFLYFMIIILLVAIAVYIFVRYIEHIRLFEEYIRIQNFILAALVLFVIRVTFRFFGEYLSFRKKSKDLSLLSLANFVLFILLIGLSIDGLSLARLLEISIITNSITFVMMIARIIQLSKQPVRV